MDKKVARIRRATRARQKFYKLGLTCLVVHRTSKHIYAQIIITNENNSKTLAVASTIENNISTLVNYTGNKEAAKIVGELIAKRALKIGIKKVTFDRSGFLYHGRVQALADAARKAGLQF